MTSPENRRERELVGALLIEEGEAQAALDVLAPLTGDDASSEVLRLRAVATLLNGGKGLDNTRRLSYVRIRAWKALGNHHALIDDIQKQLRDREDPELREELLEA